MEKARFEEFVNGRTVDAYCMRVTSILMGYQPQLVDASGPKPENQIPATRVGPNLYNAKLRGLEWRLVLSEAIGKVFDKLNPLEGDVPPATKVFIPEEVQPFLSALDEATLSLVENVPQHQ